MNSRLTYRVESICLNELNAGVPQVYCTEIKCFFTLESVWKYVGGRLKRERCGWSGIRNNVLYIVTKIA